jgi:hypothetical protein
MIQRVEELADVHLDEKGIPVAGIASPIVDPENGTTG